MVISVKIAEIIERIMHFLPPGVNVPLTDKAEMAVHGQIQQKGRQHDSVDNSGQKIQPVTLMQALSPSR